MKFGRVDNAGELNLTLPDDAPETAKVLKDTTDGHTPEVYVGCAKWNRKDLKGFYPHGTSDELTYYATQFNAVEFNAPFYNIFDKEQIETWNGKVPEHFKFFPKVNRYISHLKWLNDIEERTDDYIDSIANFKEHLGTPFLQLRSKFRPKFFDRVTNFIEYWPDGLPLAVEFRHPAWFDDEGIADELYALFEENNITNNITDTAGRRDLLHMRLTSNEAFVRYVGANHSSDFDRLDEWVDRLIKWTDQGLEQIHFFIHQNVEKKSPLLASYFIKNLNDAIGTELKIPESGDERQQDMFD